MHRLMPCVFALLLAGGAEAGDLVARVVDQRNSPVADAIITVTPTLPQLAPPPRPARTRTVNQAAMKFSPYITVARPGDRVVFHNSDQSRHHVYSFSQLKSFDFMLNPGVGSEPLLLERNGVIAVGCNIHDSMIAYLFVSDASWVARSTSTGQATASGLPAGSHLVQVWHSRQKAGTTVAAQTVLVPTSGSNSSPVLFKLALLPDPRRRSKRSRY